MEDDRRYDLGLGDDALCAIGRVSAQWAVLEYYLARTTIALAQVFGTSNAADNISFAARRTVFQNVLQCKCVPSEVRTTGVGLVNRMQAVENRRHRIVHGMANEFAGSPEDQPPAIRFSRAAPEKHWFTEILTVSQITEIADEIAKVNDVLAKLFLSIWRDYNVTGR